MFPSLRPKASYSSAQQFSFDDQAVRTRIIHIVTHKLYKAHPDNIVFLVMHISSVLAQMRKNAELGSRGIRSVDDVFLGLGYEGSTCYMGLMVNAPGAGAVQCFFKGDPRDINDLHDMSSEMRISALEVGFASSLLRQYNEIRDAKLEQKHRHA